jgi:hypothetical protein
MHRTALPAGASSRAGLLLVALSALTGCTRDDEPPETTFYSRRVEPVLENSCSKSPGTRSQCHVRTDDERHALGNLSVDSYDDLYLRRDLLITYGPYGVPGLLLKVVPDFKVSLTSWKASETISITTQIRHVGDQAIEFTSPAYTTIDNWIRNGASENNAQRSFAAGPRGSCATEVGHHPDFDPAADPGGGDFDLFARNVSSLLGESCAAGNCHGSPANNLYLTCGTTAEQIRWNHFAASDYVSADADSSEILRRVLAGASGSTYHEGGSIFESIDDPNYQLVKDWATQKGGPSRVPAEPGFEFFSSRVQPMLVKRGCMMLGCHSGAMFHDYRLRGGSGGHFGLGATRKNYELSLEQVALESPEPRASRILRKNLEPGFGGILHRGGPLFRNAPDSCDLAAAETGPLDDQDPYCVISAWILREREARMLDASPLRALVYVRRPPKTGADTPQQWEDYEAGAEVVSVGLTRGATGDLALGAETSLSAACGLDPSATDARRPAVSWDGTRIAFSARNGASEPFRIYVVEGTACEVEPGIDAAPVDDRGQPLPDNGELVHNFDPAFAPDGRIVFVSTRGNVTNAGAFTYSGPQRTPADPSKQNTNLYVLESNGSIRQLTYLLNQELLPSFMRDGRVIMTTEKRAFDFYQLAGRRINLDGTDYHPLYAQRPTIGFNQLTDVVELADKNFAAVLSERGARHGAGALAIFNRSIGVDQTSQNEDDYLVDPAAKDYLNLDFYQRSLAIWDPQATGRLSGTSGAYQAPAPLPDGRLVVSYSAGATDLGGFNGGFDIAVVDPARRSNETGARTLLIQGPEDELWPVPVYSRANLGVFRGRPDEANGSTRIDPGLNGRAQVSILDVPLLSSLLFQNTRTGRRVPAGAPIEVWESLPPAAGVKSFAAGGSFVTDDSYGQLYVRRAPLGQVPTHDDGSTQMLLRGGVPIVLAARVALAGDAEATPHFQREEMQFYPNEDSRQSFRRDQFNGLCGGCHGSVSGAEVEVAANPDILTSASDVQALQPDRFPIDLSVAAGNPSGPDFP